MVPKNLNLKISSANLITRLPEYVDFQSKLKKEYNFGEIRQPYVTLHKLHNTDRHTLHCKISLLEINITFKRK